MQTVYVNNFMRSEFDLINYIKDVSASSGTLSSRALLGIGDDCAIIPKDSETDLLLTADLLIEDIDFRLRWASPADLGHKSLAVSLSDIAAMGGTPRFSMLSLGVPEALWISDFSEQFFASFKSLATSEGVELIGGDISKSPDRLVIDSFLIGEVPRDRAIRRSGAESRDAIFVTGSLGGARAGLVLLERSESPIPENFSARLLRPTPRTAVARELVRSDAITSLIDVSDGLAGDLRHLCVQSGTGAELDVDSLPLEEGLEQAVGNGLLTSGEEPGMRPAVAFALRGGEDFELLFTVKGEAADDFPSSIAGVPVTRIGTMTGDPGTLTKIAGGLVSPLTTEGFEHFRSS